MRYQAAIFDMDGTILDTVEDLRGALGHAMRSQGYRGSYTAEEVKGFFGSGVKTAIARALRREAGLAEGAGIAGMERDAENVLREFKAYYPSHCEEATRPYSGVPELLRELREAGVRLAVVSNKIDAAVGPLCEKYFPGLFDAALGEREPEIRRKPAPDMVLAALEALGVPPEAAVCVGDTEIDLETAANSGTDCVAVAWGFRAREFLAARGAKRVVETPSELGRFFL